MSLNRRAKTKIIYGDSGATKTTQLYYLAKRYNKLTGKRVRLLSCSGGGWEPMIPLIEAGIVEAINLTALIGDSDVRLAVLRTLGKGYWPIEVAPGKGQFGQFKEFHFEATQACYNWDGVGMFMFEDCASLGQLLLAHISEKQSDTGFKHAFQINEDGYNIGGLQPGHFGLIQNELYKFINFDLASLPVDEVICTSLVGAGTDKQDKEKLFGPALVGNATVEKVPSWFGDCIYLRDQEVILEDATGKQTRIFKVAYFRDLVNEAGVPYKAKIRIQPELVNWLNEQWPQGYFPLDPARGLSPFYAAIAKQLKLLALQTTNTNNSTEEKDK